MIGSFLALVVIGLLAGVAGPWILDYIAVDRCLDSGGSFNYEACACDFENNHTGVGETTCH